MIFPHGLDLFVRQFMQVSLLIIVAGPLIHIVCRRRPHLAYLFWLVILLKCLTPPIWSSPTSIFSWTSRTSDVQAQVHKSEAALPSIAILPSRAFAPTVEAPLPTRSWSIVPIVLIVWAAGFAAVLIAIAAQWSILQRRITTASLRPPRELLNILDELRQSLGIRRQPTLLICEDSIGPAVFGIFRPVLVIPAALIGRKNLAELRLLLAHELIHLRRRDPLVAGLQILAQSIWWFNPAVWWMNRQMSRIRELCCDAEVISSLQCPPADYAQILIDVLRVGRVFSPPILSLGIRSSQITARRLNHIMSENPAFPRRTPWIYWVLLILCGLILLPGGQITLRGDDAISITPANTQPTPSTQPTQMQISFQIVHFVRVVVDFNSINFEGRRSSIDQLQTLLSQVPDRSSTVLQIANASDELTIGRFNEVQFACSNLVRDKGFKYLSYVGKQPMDSKGSPDKFIPIPSGGATKLLLALAPAPVSQLTHIPKFWTGNSGFHPGDSIVITEVRGTSDSFGVGETYQVKGTYTLASHDHATLALSVTARDPKDAYGDWGAWQTVKINRGSGTFTLTERMACEGYPHVSFYDEGKGFGGVYFGAGSWISY
jgi:beta-lactamase regulating signal transducer with metallopeptidase domain